MRQLLGDYIDQLDLALDQLAQNDRNYDRFALMLIDNVMELFLYQYAKDCNSRNVMWSSIGKEEFDVKLVNKAMGKFFNDKVKLAVSNETIEKEVGEAIINMHNFRNSAYHEGLRHESILHSITILYFKITCEVISSYKPNYWSTSSSDNISYRAMKYLGELKFPFSGESWLAPFDRLKEVADTFSEDLVVDLHTDLTNEVENINDYISYLADGSPNKMSRLEAIKEYQAWYYAFTDAGKEFVLKKYRGENISMVDCIEFIKNDYSKVHRIDPYESWLRVLSKLENEKDYKKALKIYCDFLSETSKFRDIIKDATQKLDMYIEEQIDIMRGK